MQKAHIAVGRVLMFDLQRIRAPFHRTEQVLFEVVSDCQDALLQCL